MDMIYLLYSHGRGCEKRSNRFKEVIENRIACNFLKNKLFYLPVMLQKQHKYC